MRIADLILEMLYPKHCIICGEILDYGTKEYTCIICREKAEYVQGIDYASAAKAIYGKDVYFDDCRCVFYYEYVKKAIEHFKFKKYKRDCVPLAGFMNEYGRENDVFENIDIIIPVPIHKERLKQRGFNHSYEIAKIIGEKNNIPVEENVLIRVRNTKPQYELSAEERKDNIKDAFKVVNAEAVAGKRIMLIDDVFTTGGTVNECSKVLKEAGAEHIRVFELSCSSALKKETKINV